MTLPCRTVLAGLVAAWACAPMPARAEERAVTVTIDRASVGQTWEGWGATDMFNFDGLAVEEEAGKPGPIPPEGRNEVLRLFYRDLGMTRVRFWPMGYEPENDNDDPRVLGRAGFVWEGRGTRPVTSVNPFCEDHLVLGSEFRTEFVQGRAHPSKDEAFVFYPAAHQWEPWMAVNPKGKWSFGRGDARFNPAMVEEYAEHVLAAVLHIREAYRYTLPYWSLFNEPTNTAQLSPETTLALVLAVGRRLKENGLGTRLVICDDVTPEASAEAIEKVLAHEEARGYVGAVSYHRYCGDFVLERVKPMLAKVAKGARLVKRPVSFYDSAVRCGKSVWLSEQCSYGDEGITLFDTGRARANHICDEINFGKVNAFDFMVCYFTERGKPGNEETPIFLRFKDRKFERAEINPFGQWIRHFTRHIRPGARRLGVEVDDPLVKAVVFWWSRDVSYEVWVAVVVNNDTRTAPLRVRWKPGNDAPLTRKDIKTDRVRTCGDGLYAPLQGLTRQDDGFEDALPPLSVTTYTIPVVWGDK